MKENAGAADIKLTKEEVKKLNRAQEQMKKSELFSGFHMKEN